SLGGLAYLYYDEKRLADAEQMLRRTIAIEEQLPGSHLALTGPLGTLALILVETGRAAKAEKLVRQALAIAAPIYGPEHPQSAWLLLDLGAVYHALHRDT